MQKIILAVFIMFLTITNVNAQDISKDILGKWHLKTVAVNGNKSPVKEIFGSSEIFQIYSENKKFKGIVGKQISEGEWKISDDSTIITICDKDEDTSFKIILFEDKKMDLLLEQDGKLFILSYEKQ